MADPTGTNVQVNADSTGTTAETHSGNEGSSESAIQTTGNGPDAGDSFFDPNSIKGKPELEAAYRQMQGSYTKKMQAFREHQTKIDAYDRFASDPLNTIRQIATQYGLHIVEGGKDQPKDWNPQNWDEVMSEAEKRVLKKMEPVYSELRQLKQQNVEGYLDTHYPDWRTYEDDMMDTLKTHPSLVKDPDKLYRVSVPPEVWESRAMKRAQEKLRANGEAAKVSDGKTTTKTNQEPSGPLTFNQSVEVAKKRLAAQGIRGPAG